jgi:hypothetical protein
MEVTKGDVDMIKRILNFDAHDWRHIGFLARNMFVQILKGDWAEAKDATYWIRLHLTHDSERVDDE